MTCLPEEDQSTFFWPAQNACERHTNWGTPAPIFFLMQPPCRSPLVSLLQFARSLNLQLAARSMPHSGTFPLAVAIALSTQSFSSHQRPRPLYCQYRRSSEPTQNTVSIDTASHLYVAHAIRMSQNQNCHRKQQPQKHKHDNSATFPHALRKYHCPQEVPQSLLGVTIFSEKPFSHYGLLYFL